MDYSQDLAMMKGGQMILLVDGDMLIMESDVVTPDGTMVQTDGTLILPDGTLRTLVEDEAVFIDVTLTRMTVL